MRYLLSNAVITTPGTYEYEVIDVAAAKKWLAAAPFTSTIRSAETARVLASQTGVKISTSNRTPAMQPGDEGLVFRPQYESDTKRGEEGARAQSTTRFAITNCEFGLLHCRAAGKRRPETRQRGLGAPPPATRGRGRLRRDQHGRTKVKEAQVEWAWTKHTKHKTPVEEIAAELGVAKSTLYKAFQKRRKKEP